MTTRYIAIETNDGQGALIQDTRPDGTNELASGNFLADVNGICEWPNLVAAQQVADEMNDAE